MDLSIRYRTSFTYDTAAVESHNALRACPARNGTQVVKRYDVRVDPEARIVSYVDYWGTQVDSFGVVGKHTRLTVVADAEVETSPQPDPTADAGTWPPPLSAPDDQHEYLTRTPHVDWDGSIGDFAREAVKDSRSLLDAATAIQGAVGDHLTYESGATDVGVSMQRIFEDRRGVCQDYAHLSLAMYRSLGIPVRYVSGYLYAVDSVSGEAPGDGEIEVSTHAWVEVAVQGHGWWGLDPTNQLIVGDRHVKIGHGRDYEDVTPLRGVYHGEGERGGLEVGVTMSTRPLEAHTMAPRPVYRSVPRDHHQQQQQQQQ